MNKIYRLLWSKSSGSFVAVPETAKSHGGGGSATVRDGSVVVLSGGALAAGFIAHLLPLVALLVSAGFVHAAPPTVAPAATQLPAGGQVAAGIASIAQTGAVMNITQGSNLAAINWQGFDVGAQAKVNFNQPTANSVMLNRVQGSAASQIFGQISANGRVILSNPSGVLFAPGASVDVGSLTATTHSISDTDFMAGLNKFSRNGATGSVVNEGTLTAGINGYIALLAPAVRNSGVIVARQGTVALAAGETFDLQFDAAHRLANIQVSASSIQALVDNQLAVQAPGGLIILSAQAVDRLQGGVVRNAGTLEARGIVNDGGVIRITASDRIVHSGSIVADAAPGSSGNGGTVTLIADLANPNSLTEVSGSISAEGGEQGGNGGFVDTSASRLRISASAKVSTAAPKGAAGTWLLDPYDVTIAAAGTAAGDPYADDFTPGSTSTIEASSIEAALNAGSNVTIRTGVAGSAGTDIGNITVTAPIAKTTGTAATLTLSAANKIDIDAAANISSSADALHLVLDAGGGTGTFSSVFSGSGSLTKTGAGTMVLVNNNTYSGTTTISAGTLQIGAGGTVGTLGSGAVTNDAALSINRSDALTVANAISGAGNLAQIGTGTTTLTGSNTYTGTTTISAGTLQIGAGGTAGTLGSGAVTNDAALSINRSDALTVTNAIGGTGSLAQTGTGTTTLTGSNIYTGTTTISIGTLALSGGSAIASTGAVNLSNSGANLTLDAALTIGSLAGVAGTTVALGGNTLTTGGSTNTAYAGTVGGAGGLIKQGSGTFTLSGTNTYSGGTTVSAGTLQIGAGGTVGSVSGTISNSANLTFNRSDALSYGGAISGTGTLNQSGSGTLTLGGSNTYSGGSTLSGGTLALGSAGAIGSSGAISFEGGSLQHSASNLSDYSNRFSNAAAQAYAVDTNGQNITLATALSSAGGTLNKLGAGTLTLSGNNIYSGITTISAGTLQVGSGGTAGSLSGDIVNNAALVFNRSNALSYGGVISGTGTVSKLGAGTLTLGGANSYTGNTTISTGTLAVSGSLADTTQVSIASGAVYSLGASDTVGSIEGAGNITTTASSGTVTLTADMAGALSKTFSGVMSSGSNAALAFAKAGAGSLTLTGSNTYTGGTTLTAGTLSLGSANAIASSGAINFLGGTLQFTGSNTTDYSARFGTTANQIYSFDTNGQNVTLASALVSTGSSMAKLGAGTLTMPNASGFTTATVGTATIAGGILLLKVAHPNSLTSDFSGAGALTIEPSSTSFTSAVSTSGLLLSASGGLGSLTIGKTGNQANLTLDGFTGAVVLNGSQSYYGGVLTVASTNPISWTNSGTLLLSAYTSININAAINVAGANAATAGVTLMTNQGGTGGDYKLGFSAAGFSSGISFSAPATQGFKTQDGTNSANLKTYTLVGSLADMYGLSNTATHYALASDIDASGFINPLATPVNYANVRGGTYTGTFAGLGHTINRLSLGTTGTANVGMFNTTGNGAIIRDLRLAGITIAGGDSTGSLVGYANNSLTLSNLMVDAYVNGSTTVNSSVTAPGYRYVGGLVGIAYGGTLSNAYVLNTPVSGGAESGGVVGWNDMTATNVHKTGNITANGNYVGGLVGNNNNAVFTNSDSTGDVTSSGNHYIGGLLGWSNANVVSSWTSGNVTAAGGGNFIGGLVGIMGGSRSIIDSYATGNVNASGNNWVGGLVGHIAGHGTVTRSYDSGTVTGNQYVGGLVGGTANNLYAYDSYFSGASVIGSSERVGGLVGQVGNNSDVRNSYVTAGLIQGSQYVGGLVGLSENSITIVRDGTGTYTALDPYSTASVAASNQGAGGLVGWVSNGNVSVTDARMTGSYVRGAGNYAGGLVGYASSNVSILRSYASGTSVTGGVYVGGLVGNMYAGSIVNSYFSGAITGSAEYGGLAGYMRPGAWLSNSFYNIDSSLINGGKVVTPGGLYNGQYAAWVASNATVASRSLNITDYFSLGGDGYYSVATVSDSAGQSDFSNMLGFVQSSSAGAVNSYKFKLANDIDMSTATMPYLPYFSATEFKGNGFTANNFSFNRPTSEVGFMGMVFKSTITDLKVNSVAYAGQTSTNYGVNAREYTGTAIGSIYDGLITGSTATLAGAVNGLDYTGGFVGWAQAPITGSTATLVAGVTGANYTGGFAGWARGVVTGSTTTLTGSVLGSNYTGGFAGWANGVIANTSAVLATSSTASVTGQTFTGGLVGYMASVAANNLNSNLGVTGTQRVGGLAGYLDSNYTTNNAAVTTNTATNLSASGAVTGTSDRVGGLIGEATGSTVVLSNSTATGRVLGSNSYVGGLVGLAYGGAYNNLLATGQVTQAGGGTQVGGLVGQFSATSLSNSEARGVVSGAGNYAGGLVGYLNSNVVVADSRYTTGTVTGNNSYVGGLIGYAGSNTQIKGSYSTQAVTGANDFVGGLVGKLTGSIVGSANSPILANGSVFSYASGNVTGRYDVGGLVGRADSTAIISNAFSTGAVTGNANFGGLLGYLTPGAQVSNSHYNIDAVAISGFTPASPSTRVTITGLVTIGGLYGAQYGNWVNGGTLDGLATTATNNAASYFGAAVGGVYSLSTVQHLRDYLGFADQTGLSFKLGANIDLGGAAGLYIPYVSGAFDPNGNTISNLTLSQYTSGLGFIGHLRGVTTTLALAGLTVTNASVLGKTNLGAAVGSTYLRALTTPYTSGSVTGSDIAYANDPGDDNNGRSNVGGVIGYALGAGSNTAVLTGGGLAVVASAADVSGGTNTGGLIGRISTGALTAASSTGTVTGTADNTGGLVGRSGASVIYNASHTTGLVKGVNYVGGLVGQSSGNVGEAAGAFTTANPTYTTFASSNVEASGSYVGGLLGRADGGSVVNVAASGTVTGYSTVVSGFTSYGYASSYTGGLIGESNLGVSYSKYTGVLVKGGHRTGGLVGNNNNYIGYSFASAGAANSSAVMSNSSWTGGLAGYSGNNIDNSYATATVTGGADRTGGLVGYAQNTVTNSRASGDVVGGEMTGGLIGHSNANLTSNTAAGAVRGNGNYVGGLAGYVDGGFINLSSATGNVEGFGERVGGLVGHLQASLTASSATGNVVGRSHYVGGLVGLNYSNITNATATGNVYGWATQVGGLVGGNHGGAITNSQALITSVNATTGYGVSGTESVGGLVGWSQANISGSTALATVRGTGNYTGGFVGYLNGATISGSGAFGFVTGPSEVGGFVGQNYNGNINTSFSNDTVSSTGNSTSGMAGGFVGQLVYGSITSSRAAGSVTSFGRAGGFAGYLNNTGNISQAYATGSVTQNSTSVLTSTQSGTGGFVGYLDSNYTGSISDVYAMGAVVGKANVGGLVGYADRGTISNAFATGHVSSSSGAASVGGVFGAVNINYVSGSSGPLRVTRSNLYFDTTTSNQSSDGYGGVGMSISALKAVLPTGFVITPWATGAGLYPYLTAFYSTTPRAADGIATLSNGTVAVRGQVTQYSNGTLLNGGSASTGANGYYYSLVGANTLFTDSAIAESVSGIALVSGGANYTSLPTVSITGGGGTGATATVTRNSINNTISGITLTNAGSGYTSAPTVVVTGGGASSVATFITSLFAPRFTTATAPTSLATTLKIDGSSRVDGMVYTDLLSPDVNINLTDTIRQGVTRLRTGAATASAMNTQMDSTIGAAARAVFSTTLPTISSLELSAAAASFNLNTALAYSDNGVSNAGLITVTGTAVTLSGGNFFSTKAQSYIASLTLGADALLSGTSVTTSSTVAGAGYNLTVTGNLFTGSSMSGLGVFGVSGNTLLGGNVASSGNQSYGGLLTLGVDATLLATGSNSAINLAGAINSDSTGRALTINASGGVGSSVVIGSAVGGNAPLGSLTVSAGSMALNGGPVQTTGFQSYTGAVVLGADTTLSGVAITFASTVKSNGTNRSLTLNDSGLTTFGGAVGGSTTGEALSSLSTDAAGSTAINGGSVRSSGAQTYGDAVTLGADTTLTGSTITTLGTVVGSSHALTITGNAVLGDAAADTVTGLTALAISGSTAINTNAVSSTGTQTYSGSVTLGADTTLTGSTISTLGTVVGNAHALTVTGNAVLGDAAADTVTGLSTLAVSGSTAINTGAVSSSGTQTYAGPVTLGADSTLTGAAITLASTVKSDGTNRSLTINDSGLTTLSGAVGGSGTAGEALSSLSTDAAGSTAINGGSVRSSGAQTYGDAVTLGADTTLTGVAITLAGTVKSDGTNRSLSLNDSGLTTLGGAVGGSGTAGEALSSLSTDAAGSTAINGGSVRSTGAQTYGDAVTLGADTTLSYLTSATLGSVVGNAHALTLSGNLVVDAISGVTTLSVLGETHLGGNIMSTGAQIYVGAMTLSGSDQTLTAGGGVSLAAVDSDSSGARSLSIVSTGTTSSSPILLGGSVGALHALSSLTTTADYITLGDGVTSAHTVTTTGDQRYNGILQLKADTTLSTMGSGATGGNFSTTGALNGLNSARSLTVVAGAGDATFGGAIGGNTGGGTGISSLTVGAATLSAGAINVINALSLSPTVSGTVSGVISGAAATLTQGGAGNLVLTGTNTYGGNTTVSSGSLTLQGSGSLGSGSYEGGVAIGSGATLRVSTSVDQTLGGAISGSGALVKDTSTASTLTLTSANSYTGGTTIDAGSLTLGADNVLADAAAITVNGGSLDIGSHSDAVGTVTLNSGAIRGSTGVLSAASVVASNSAAASISAILGGSGGLDKYGAGTLTLSGANSYTGSTTVNAGTLAIANPTGLGGVAGGTTVASGAVLDLQGMAVGSEAIILNGGTLTASTGISGLSGPLTLGADSKLNVTGEQLSLSGVISSNSYGLALAGTGAFDLSNAANTLATIASDASLASLRLKNSSDLTVGSVRVGGNSYSGISSVGAVSIINAASVTLAGGSATGSGHSIDSTGGSVVLAASRLVNNFGPSALSTGGTGQQWQVWSSNATPFDSVLGDVVNGLFNAYVQYNATYGSSAVQGVGHGLLYTLAPTVTVDLTGVSSRLYNGTTAAALTADNYTLSSSVNGDVLSLNNPALATLTSQGSGSSVAGVGSGKAVTATGLILTAVQGAKPVYGYTLASSTVVGDVGVVTAVPLNMFISKTYDGLNSLTQADNYALTGMVGQEAAPTISSGLATLSSANAGSYSSFSSNTFSLSNSNYTLAGGAMSTVVNAAPLGISVTGTYSGSTAIAPLTHTVSGLVHGETLLPTGVTVSNKNVAGNGSNYVTAISATDSAGTAMLSNYILAAGYSASPGAPSVNTADISPADLQVTGLAAVNKVYNATTVAGLSGNAAVALLGRDIVTLGGTAAGAFADKNVGSGKAVAVSGVAISGADAGNYKLLQPAGLTADISQADLQVTGLAAVNKAYNATAVAALSGSATVALLGSDIVTLGGTAAGTFANKNVGSSKAVAIIGVSISGADAGNYKLLQQVGLDANITPAPLTVTTQGVTKTYDTSAVATLAPENYLISGFFDNDSAAVTRTQGAFDSASAGSGKAVTVRLSPSDYTASASTTLSNYRLATVTTDAVGAINKADLTITAIPSISGNVYSGMSYAGTYTTSALGSDAAGFAVTGIAVGIDAGRYGSAMVVRGAILENYNTPVIRNAELVITPKPATLSNAAKTTIYDGVSSYAALVSTTAFTSSGLVGADGVGSVTQTANLLGLAKAGSYTATPSESVMSTGKASNYSFSYQATTSSVDKAKLSISASSNTKTFDGNSASASRPVVAGLLGSDTVSGLLQAYADSSAGQGKTLTVLPGYTLADQNSGNNYTLTLLDDNTGVINAIPVVVTAPVPPPPIARPPAPPLNVAPVAALAPPLAPVAATAPAPAVVAAAELAPTASATPTPAPTPTAAVTSSGISISSINQATQQSSGLVSVLIPQSLSSAPAGLTIALPATVILQGQENTSPATASLLDNQPLPAWIRYDVKLNALVIDSAASAVFPLTVVLMVGGQSTVIQVAEAKDK
jgi:filamentous hemagglutinin family protein